MAARCVYKLISKTYSLTSNSAYSSTIPTISTDKCYRKQQRSYSQPPQKNYEPKKETFIPIRNISKSLEDLGEIRYREDDYETDSRQNTFPSADLNVREPAKEFKERYVQEEQNEDGNPIYELAECNRSQENFYDVLSYMRRAEALKMKTLFLHLQPNNIKPYGSSENLIVPLGKRKKIKIVYPTTRIGSQTEVKKTKSGKVHYKEYSTKATHKEYPSVVEETKKMAICESRSSLDRKNYSTTSMKKKPVTLKFPLKVSNRTVCKVRKTPCNEEMPTRESPKHVVANAKKMNKHKMYRVTSKELLLQCANIRRSYNTQNKPVECTALVTVKLNELKDECRKAKKCKPKKISFGRLPKLTPPDCPCFEDIPLNEGKPLGRLKKRFNVKEPKEHCVQHFTCTTPRADANYKILPKVLPKIEVQDCPCEIREMTDFIIKRLPKRKVPEPKRVCNTCEDRGDCCPPRADGKIEVKRKSLPQLQINHCPCKVETPLKDIPLRKLKKVFVEEPKRICIEKDICDETLRADYGLKIEKKTLREIEGKCPCPVLPQIEDGPPIPRLKKVKVPEKPRPPCDICCDINERADKVIIVHKKKLPKFKAQNCPCIETPPPDKMVKLKRLEPKPVKEKPRTCGKKVECGPRADDNLVIKPKQLPKIEVHECPCILEEMKDNPPLKRLVPKPIEEKPRVCKKSGECTVPRSDENLKVKKKVLPVMPPGNCPCVEAPPPLEVKPLAKLKKKPVSSDRICPRVEPVCDIERADEHYTIKMKQLPRLEINNCPCVELEPPEDVPLTRLRKVKIPEPPRVCKSKDDCADIPRADKDDWMYWRRVAVKCEPEDLKNSKKCYSTFASNRRYYSTTMRRENNIFSPKYDVSTVLTNKINNIIIDIKPSAPLILSQTPIDTKQKDILRLSKSEPIDNLAFVVFKSNNLVSTKPLKETVTDASSGFNTRNRYISTCSTLCEYSERPKDNLKDHVTPSCECPANDLHLQPKYPIIPKRETFITPYPDDDWVYETAKKGRKFCRNRKDQAETIHVTDLEECPPQEEQVCTSEATTVEECVEEEPPEQKPQSLWERIVNYFKARPNCPSPDEFKKIKLREDAERAAQKAGLCLYDPKEMLKKSEKELPKVITADPSKKEDCEK